MTGRNTLIGIDPKMFEDVQPVTDNRRLFRVERIACVDDEFFVYAESRGDVEEIVCARAIVMDLPLIWREIEAM
jgi:hypothetical protein